MSLEWRILRPRHLRLRHLGTRLLLWRQLRSDQGRSQHIATYRIAIGFALRYIAKGLRYIAKLRG